MKPGFVFPGQWIPHTRLLLFEGKSADKDSTSVLTKLIVKKKNFYEVGEFLLSFVKCKKFYVLYAHCILRGFLNCYTNPNFSTAEKKKN